MAGYAPWRVVCGGLLAIGVLLGGRPGGVCAAEHCPVTIDGAVDPRLAGLAPDARIDFIDAHLAAVAKRARIWTWGWGGGIAASGVASLAVVPFVDRADRVDWYTSAASAAIGVIPFAVAPLVVMRDARELHADVLTARQGAATDLCPLLRDAESRLARDAADQRAQQAWWLHAGNVAFNTGIVLFLGLAFHHWTSGLINGLSGVAVGEAILLTQPVGSVRDLQTYRTASF